MQVTVTPSFLGTMVIERFCERRQGREIGITSAFSRETCAVSRQENASNKRPEPCSDSITTDLEGLSATPPSAIVGSVELK
jgi:hypothetical protein